jgi:hypothetical protein
MTWLLIFSLLSGLAIQFQAYGLGATWGLMALTGLFDAVIEGLRDLNKSLEGVHGALESLNKTFERPHDSKRT